MNDAEFLKYLEKKYAVAPTGWVRLEFDDWRRFTDVVTRVRGLYCSQDVLHGWFLEMIRDAREQITQRILNELRK